MGSVCLVGAAQLGMRWSMTRLPGFAALADHALPLGALAVLAIAILAYALSMLCWLGALRDLPLGQAYSMLSISYALVYLLAAGLPAFHEDFSALKTLGVTLVVLGVIVINWRRPHDDNA